MNQRSSQNVPILAPSMAELNVPLSKASGEDTSRTDLDVINPSMHIAETEDCNCRREGSKLE